MPEDVRLCVTTYLSAKNISEQVYHFCLYQKASVYVCVFFSPCNSCLLSWDVILVPNTSTLSKDLLTSRFWMFHVVCGCGGFISQEGSGWWRGGSAGER